MTDFYGTRQAFPAAVLLPALPALLAIALAVWPLPGAARRLNHERINHEGLKNARTAVIRRAGRSPALGRAAVLGAAALLGILLLGPAGSVSGALLAALAVRYRQHRLRTTRGVRSLTELAAGLRVLIGELGTGAHPSAAAASASTDTGGDVSELFGDLAVTSRLGGTPAESLGAKRPPPELLPATARFARCWRMSEQHGVALGRLLETVREDAEHRVRVVRDIDSKLAGPRATAAVLSGLPLLGLLLGETGGADPIGVLVSEPVGQLLLLVGTALLCAGVLWVQRLTEVAMRP
ncbi:MULTISPECIES: type II secretion system F family protein [unclassified Actinopolyspora]|uniref:type II secretion system F family protein n=1 Tax=unclassified Actinopolyspora TaxID=2639451 RepID=UPI0013F616B1|nr:MULTISPECIES: type II secretion system F family protein [unclassified Actinopolyspora]NHD19171.1 secretion system protein [Actinopolyspora sp. BKK2]NHE78295.1 secretion system protein [Actinopolyspora sp. BKK1]